MNAMYAINNAHSQQNTKNHHLTQSKSEFIEIKKPNLIKPISSRLYGKNSYFLEMCDKYIS
jgi:hypothetical protein